MSDILLTDVRVIVYGFVATFLIATKVKTDGFDNFWEPNFLNILD